jgi:mono/diheme cytochrome c family protein
VKTPKITGLGLVFLGAAALAGAALAQGKGAYTEAQAQRGDQTYQASCALCHGASLTGGPGAPALTGPEFAFGWKEKSAGELFDYVKANMPPGGAGTLSDSEYADVVARILKANGAPAGDKELPTDTAALKGVRIAQP